MLARPLMQFSLCDEKTCYSVVDFSVTNYALCSLHDFKATILTNEDHIHSLLNKNVTLIIKESGTISGIVVTVADLAQSNYKGFQLVMVQAVSTLRFYLQSVISTSFCALTKSTLLMHYLSSMNCPRDTYEIILLSDNQSKEITAVNTDSFSIFETIIYDNELLYFSREKNNKEVVYITDNLNTLEQHCLNDLTDKPFLVRKTQSLGMKEVLILHFRKGQFDIGEQVLFQQKTYTIVKIDMQGKQCIQLGTNSESSKDSLNLTITLEASPYFFINKKAIRVPLSLQAATVVGEPVSTNYLSAYNTMYRVCYDFLYSCGQYQINDIQKSMQASSAKLLVDFKLKPKTKVVVICGTHRPFIMASIPEYNWESKLPIRASYQLTSYNESSLTFNEIDKEITLSAANNELRLALSPIGITFINKYGDLRWDVQNLLAFQISQTITINGSRFILSSSGDCSLHGADARFNLYCMTDLSIHAKNQLQLKSKQTLAIKSKYIRYDVYSAEMLSINITMSGKTIIQGKTVNLETESFSVRLGNSCLWINQSGVFIKSISSEIHGPLKVLKV